MLPFIFPLLWSASPSCSSSCSRASWRQLRKEDFPTQNPSLLWNKERMQNYASNIPDILLPSFLIKITTKLNQKFNICFCAFMFFNLFWPFLLLIIKLQVVRRYFVNILTSASLKGISYGLLEWFSKISIS